MYHLLPSSVMNPGYAGIPSLATSQGRANRQPQGGRGGGGGGGGSRERRRVTIFRNSLDTPWGFRVQGGKDLNAPLSVKRVFSGSPADGQLTRDDLILAIDDQPTDGLSSAQVSETIRSAGTSIVLTIETSPYDSAFDNSFEPIRNVVQHQQTKREPAQQSQPKRHETKASDYHHSFQSSPSAIYETSPPDHSRQTASAPYSKVTTTTTSTAKGHHRSANRFQATPAVPYGISEPGWAPKSKPAAKESPTATVREPPPSQPRTVSEAPVPQHRSARQQNAAKAPGSSGGGGDAGWRSQYAAVDDPSAPRLVRLAAIESGSSPMGGSSSQGGAEPHARRRRRSSSDRTGFATGYAEPTGIDGIATESHLQGRSSRFDVGPASLQSGSVDTGVGRCSRKRTPRIPHARAGARSAPETPTADTCSRTMCSDAKTVPHQAAAAAYSQQQVDGSAPVKIQPSLLFGNRSATKSMQLQSQTRAPARAQPQEIKVTPHDAGQPREDNRAAGFQLVSTRKEQPAVPVFKVPAAHPAQTATRIVSAPQARATETARGVPSSPAPVTVAKQPVEEPPKPATRVLPTVQAESVTPAKTIECFKPVPDTPKIENLIQAQKAHPPSAQIERYNPTPDRPQRTTATESVSESPVKFTQTPVERFNPTPDKREKLTQPSVLHSYVKSQTTLVERFNPTPDKEEKVTKPPVSYSQVKSQPSVVERFNPTPDKGEKVTKPPVSYSQVKSQTTLVERFNPTPDKEEKVTKQPVSYSQVKSQPSAVERFNPTPDKQEKPSVALSPPKPLSAPLVSTSQQPARLSKPTVISAPLKVSPTPTERFNPTPDRPQNIPKATAMHISKNILQAPLERFNPTPDPPPTVPQRQIERFNPVPDRP